MDAFTRRVELEDEDAEGVMQPQQQQQQQHYPPNLPSSGRDDVAIIQPIPHDDDHRRQQLVPELDTRQPVYQGTSPGAGRYQCSRIRIFRFFSDFKKNMSFYVFLKWCIKKS